MTRLQRSSLLCLLSLLAGCDRDIYVGRDIALERRAADSGAVAAPPESSPPTADAGSSIQTSTAAGAGPEAGATPALPPAAISPCDTMHADCDGDPSTGCETDLTSDRDHCGACQTRCETADCSCNNGMLTLDCASGYGDCDGSISNGCETDLQTSLQHCGACQRTCHTNGHDVTSAMCTSGRCQVTCAPRISPEADCDGNPDNGCESYLMFDAQNCGQCGNVCTRCEAGICTP